MEEKYLDNWSEFEQKIHGLNAFREKLRDRQKGHVSKLLFRGQGNACWKLSNTLERHTARNEFESGGYYRKAERVRPEIETFTERRWHVSIPDFEKWEKDIVEDRTSILLLNSIPSIDYMIYLRHHGFPSPLLDWTRSPYVAAYFSCNNPVKDAKRVSIYAYIEWTGKGKSQNDGSPVIARLEVDAPSHRRHYVQQSEYTVCVKEDGERIVYTSHEDAFAETEQGENLLWKFTLPSSERVEVLNKLDHMNINSLSLFGTEDSLMETIALREFDFADRDL